MHTGEHAGDHSMAIGENIKKARENKGLTREQAAELCGISPSTWTKYERGEAQPTASPIRTMAKGLQVSTDELLLDADERSVPADLIALFREIARLPEADQGEIRRALKGHIMVLHQQHMG